MNAQKFRIVVASVVILFLIGIGAFLVYDMNAPVQQVRVYEVPEPAPRAVLVDPVARGAPVTASSNQEPQMLDDNASPLLSEECCPDDLSELVALDDGMVYDSNPVSPEVIEDARRISEWQEAFALHQEKTAAHDAEGNELMQKLMSIIQELDAAQGSDERIYDKEYALRMDNQIAANLEALIPKIENWGKRGTALLRDAPKYPTFTHSH